MTFEGAFCGVVLKKALAAICNRVSSGWARQAVRSIVAACRRAGVKSAAHVQHVFTLWQALGMNGQQKGIWIVSELFHPSQTSTGHILTTIATSLARRAAVSVVTGPPSYWSRSNRIVAFETFEGVDIHRVTMPFIDKNVNWKRAIRLLLVSLLLVLKVIKEVPRGSRVLIVTNPLPLLFVFSQLKRIKRLEVVVLVHDVYPGNMAAAGLIKKNGFLYAIIDKLFVRALARADQIIVIGRDMQKLLQRRGLPHVRLIENWADTEAIWPIEKRNATGSQRPELVGKRVFLFAGNFGRVQALPLLLEAIDQLDGENVHFIFAGNGALQPAIEACAMRSDSSHVQVVGTFDRDSQINVLNSCDVGIVSLDEGMYGLGVPSKTYNLLAAGKPVLFLGDQDSEIDLLIREHLCGWSLAQASAARIVEKIREICLLPDTEIQTLGANASRIARELYSQKASMEKYEALLLSRTFADT